MSKRHLHAVTASPDAARADREAAAILTEYGLPTTYDRMETLLSVAYLKGCKDGLEIGERIALGTLGGAS